MKLISVHGIATVADLRAVPHVWDKITTMPRPATAGLAMPSCILALIHFQFFQFANSFIINEMRCIKFFYIRVS